MKHNIIKLTLVISLLANIFFITGFHFAQVRAKRIAQKEFRIQEMVRQLDLTPEQQRVFRRLKKKAVNLRRSYIAKKRESQSILIQTLLEQDSDFNAVEQIIHTMAEDREKYQRGIAAVISEFTGSLTPEQKKKFLEISKGNTKLSALLSG